MLKFVYKEARHEMEFTARLWKAKAKQLRGYRDELFEEWQWVNRSHSEICTNLYHAMQRFEFYPLNNAETVDQIIIRGLEGKEADNAALRQRVEALEAALNEIATSKYQAYPEPFEINPAATSQYKIGIADGHRFCANVARRGLGAGYMSQTEWLKLCYRHFKSALTDCMNLTTDGEVERMVKHAFETEPKPELRSE